MGRSTRALSANVGAPLKLGKALCQCNPKRVPKLQTLVMPWCMRVFVFVFLVIRFISFVKSCHISNRLFIYIIIQSFELCAWLLWIVALASTLL